MKFQQGIKFTDFLIEMGNYKFLICGKCHWKLSGLNGIFHVYNNKLISTED